MKIFLLTHEREVHRATNTGAIALDNANEIVERILWQRLDPNKILTQLIENNQAILLYSKGSSSAVSSELPIEKSASIPLKTPSEMPAVTPLAIASDVPSAMPIEKLEDYENIIIIDSTWQEAKKIYNHSPYLKNAPQFTLKTTNDSLYKLRANQPKGGLCTIECIIEVLRIKGRDKIASELSLKFEQFNSHARN